MTAATVWVVTWLAITKTVLWGNLTLSLSIPSACVALFVLVVLRQRQTWVWPVQRMSYLLPLVRSGELPIESLSEIDGGLAEFAGQIRALLHELRRQKTRTAEVEAEMHHKVANRTDALERTIGSLRQQATRDALTGLYNRRMLDRCLPEFIDKCRKEKSDLALLMIDVDHFKGLNDTLGHAAGDELLRNIGQIIRSTIRDQDSAFRCGGDEFVILMPCGNMTSAETLAERVRSLVSELTKTIRVPQKPKLSIGISTLGELQDPNPQGLLEDADKRLYAVKSARGTRPVPTLQTASLK
ncbi:MAG TPA: GGDEF domain-containing protein [Tepidisphaeraceae bacterium]|nr:GGDEF domain-containing protein [Tepidisphaeraceae bacterium]